MNLMRRIAVAAVAALGVLGLAGSPSMAAPAPAAAATVIIVKYDQVAHEYTATPDFVELNVGDTFKVENRLMGSGDEFYVAVVNTTGSVRMGSTACETVSSCKIADDSPNNPVETFTAVSAGTVRVIRFDGLAAQPITRVGGVRIIDPAPPKSITITGKRTTLSGKPSIQISGESTGFGTGTPMTVHVRFPGGDYSPAASKPEVDSNGAFTWQRKTGKKTYIYVTSLDGEVKSDRIIIPAR